MEVLLLRQNSIEQRLKVLFAEGDENGDGVLSFEEFNGIVARCALFFISKITFKWQPVSSRPVMFHLWPYVAACFLVNPTDELVWGCVGQRIRGSKGRPLQEPGGRGDGPVPLHIILFLPPRSTKVLYFVQ